MSNHRSTDLDNCQIFSENLRNLLAEKGVSQKELGKSVGASSGTVCDWCNGRAYPRMDKLQKIAAFLEVEKYALVEKHSVHNKHYLTGEAKRIARELMEDTELILFHQSFKKLSKKNRAIVLSLLESLPKEDK